MEGGVDEVEGVVVVEDGGVGREAGDEGVKGGAIAGSQCMTTGETIGCVENERGS